MPMAIGNGSKQAIAQSYTDSRGDRSEAAFRGFRGAQIKLGELARF
jgi:hypothetical protein